MTSTKVIRTALIPLILLAAVTTSGHVMAQDAASAAKAPLPAQAAPPQPIVLAQAQAPTSGSAQQFKLGTHYERLSPTQPTSSGPDKIEVAEIFWYGCPHCFTFDPYVETWREDLPADVSFVRIPALWNELLQIHARIYYTAEALNKLDEMHSAIFRAIHVEHNPLNTPDSIRDFFGMFGVDAATFDNTFESFAVYTKIQRADELARRYRVSSVPTIVVNGKYKTNATMAGSYPKLLEVVDELVAMERAGE